MAKPFVIMLDLDGPICTTRAVMATGDYFDPIAGRLLSKLCDQSGARIVIISARRNDDNLIDALGRIDLARHLFDDPVHWRTGHDSMAIRGNEVDAWHAANPGHRYAIVDDERGGYAAHHIARLVHTGMHTGLQVRDLMLLKRYMGMDAAKDLDHFDAQYPRITLANTAAQALAALDQGDDQAVRDLLAIIQGHPLAQ